MKDTSGRILDQVIGLVEPLTRFDRSAVLSRDESTETLPCTGKWTASITISSKASDGAGELPADVRDAGSEAGMEQAVNEAVAAGRAQVAHRVQAWCSTQSPSSPAGHKPLAAGDCLGSITRVGYAWQCPSCKGHGKITCTKCKGHGQLTCPLCDGKGHTKCSHCNGSGKSTCSQCGGSRNVSRTVTTSAYNPATGEYAPKHEIVNERCPGCASGDPACGMCSGRGKTNCWQCNTTGKVQCGTCHGKGEQTCKDCEGSGSLHRLAETHCEVINAFAIDAGQFADDDRKTMAGWDFPLFCELASATSEAPVISPLQLERSYPATLSRSRAHIQCAGQDLLLTGYGPEARVFDFKGIVGHLVASDLEQLRTALDASPGFLPFLHQQGLRTALASMLQSELNQQLADPEQRQALVANGTVTEEHAATTVDALRKALGRLSRGPAAAGLAVLFVVAILTLHRLLSTGHMLPGNRFSAAVIFLVIVAVTAVAVGLLSRFLFLKSFAGADDDPEAREAVIRLMDTTGAVRHWWIAAAITVVVAFVGFLAVTL